MKYSRHSGMTLIEVVASLTLLAILFAAAVTAFASYRRQQQHALRLNQACDMLDDVIARAWHDPKFLERQTSGSANDAPDLAWQVAFFPATGDLANEKLQVARFVAIDRKTNRELTSVSLLLENNVQESSP